MFPGYGLFKLYITSKREKTKEEHKDLEVYIESVRSKTFMQSIFNILFMIRRLLMVIVMISLTNFPLF